MRAFVHAYRALGRAPVYAATVIAIMSLGIGANGAVLGIIDTIFFRQVPVPNPEQLVGVGLRDRRDTRRDTGGPLPFPVYRDIAERVPVVDLAAAARWRLDLGASLAGTSVDAVFVSDNFFTALARAPARGRVITPADAKSRVAVISDWFWTHQLSSDENVLGQEIVIGPGRFTIIGVMPPRYNGAQGEGRVDIWLPYAVQPEATGEPFAFEARDRRLMSVIGRLRAGGTIPQVQAGLDQVAAELATADPRTERFLRLTAYSQEHFSSIEQAPAGFVSSVMVWAMIALLQVVACSNIATLMLARAAAARRALGIRLCLGASPARITAETLAEPLLLAAGGAVGGILVARAGTKALTQMWFLSALDPGLDLRGIAILLLIAATTAVVCGWFPARDAARRDPAQILLGVGGGRVAGASRDATPLLITGQLAISLVLLVNAAVFYRTFQRQLHGDPGFETRRLAVISLPARPAAGSEAHWARLDAATGRLRTVPGVVQVAAGAAPLLRAGPPDDITVAGHDYAPGEPTLVSAQTVGAGYFATVGARLVEGREFTERDGVAGGESGFSLAVVNESFARRYWGDGPALGRRLSFRRTGSATVIGVVRDLHDVVLSTAIPRVYFPLREWRSDRGLDLLVRTEGDPATLRSQLYAAAAGNDPVSAPAVRTMRQIVDDALALSRIGGIMLATSGVIALVLTMMGLYGLVASWVLARRHEIAIRGALGAERYHLYLLVFRVVGAMVGGGCAAGALGAAGVIRLERAWWGPSIQLEAISLWAAVALLVIVAAVAAWAPSRRAIARSPSEVLHST